MAITSYQTGTITLNAAAPGNLSGSVTLGTTVTQGNAILVATLRGGSNAVGQYNVRVVLSSDGTTVTAARNVSGSEIVVEFQVIEAPEFNVQHFEKTIALAGVSAQAITSVDTDYAFVICTGLSATGSSRGSDDFVSVDLTSATNVDLQCGSNSTIVVAFQVVEMSAAEIASVQKISTAISGVVTDAAISSVDTAKSLLFSTARLAVTSVTIVNRSLPNVILTSSTNLRLETPSHFDTDMTVVTHVVEFANLAVTHAVEAVLTGSASTTEILGAAPVAGGALVNAIMGRYSAVAENDDDSTTSMFTATLSGATWTFERASTNFDASLAYSVFDWADIFSPSGPALFLSSFPA